MAAGVDTVPAAAAARPKEVVFHVEVHGASGLPKPERTLLRLSGFGIRPGGRCSLPLQEHSSEPTGWLFEDAEVEAQRVKAEAEMASANAASKAKPKGKAAPVAAPVEVPTPAVPPEPFLRLAQPCGTAGERQRMLDQVCTPLSAQVLRAGTSQKQLATATVELQALIHDTATVEVEVGLTWSPDFLEELRQEADESAAAAAAEAGSEGVGKADSGQEGELSEANSPLAFSDPPPGTIRARISTASPIGRALCPEDLHDWAILTVQVHGCFSLPESLLSAGGTVPEGISGIIAEHPLRYSLRLLGCQLDGGQLHVPQVEKPDDAQGNQADMGAPSPTNQGDGPLPDEDLPREPPPVSFDIGKDEFVEGLIRSGFVTANEDGPVIFDYLSRPRTDVGGRLGLGEFVRLRDIGIPADTAKLRHLFDQCLEKYGQLDEAFNKLDEAAEGSLTLEALQTGLARLEHNGGPEEAQALFAVLDTQAEGQISREDFRTLALHRRMDEIKGIEKVKRWLLDCCGSVGMLTKQVDDQKSGMVTQDRWKSAMQRLNCPYPHEAEALFQLLDVEQAGSFQASALDVIPSLDATLFAKALPRLQELLLGPVLETISAEEAFTRLRGEQKCKTLTTSEFTACCRRIGYNLSIDPHIFFRFLDEGDVGCIGASELALLPCYNRAMDRHKLAACKSFVEDTYGSVEAAFQPMFDDQTELTNNAEATQPFIEWPEATTTVYCGREWLQRLLNTLQDDRGRKCTDHGETASGGSWLYFFPRPTPQSQLVDFKDVADPAQKELTRLSRWHHAQAFVDLRRLVAEGSSDCSGPQLEFRAFLAQVRRQPQDISSSGELPKPVFAKSRTYVKGSIRLDRPLVRLCPRSIPPLPELDGKPFVPPPPEKAPPPTVSEELELEARRLVGRLAGEFARMCHERGLVETQVGKLSEHKLLGRKGVRLHMFAEWLQEQDDGSLCKDLAAELRPAIVRLVRAEAKDGPSCGLSGNENDARYSNIRDLILRHLFRALNEDVSLNQRKQDSCLWMSPSLQGEAYNLQAEVEPMDVRAEQAEDATLQRLIFEYECLGEYGQSIELYEKRLALPQNALNGTTWFDYARFLMRCGQRQLEAEKALRYAMSLSPAEQGPSIEEVAFLACMLLNRDLPCSLDKMEDGASIRFQTAISVLAKYADSHPGEHMPLYFLFLVYASEAWALQTQLSSATSREGNGEDEAVEQALLMAEATKYLELANMSPGIFSGTMVTLSDCGQPVFPELEELIRCEKKNRGEPQQVPACPKLPEADERQEQPVFESYEARHLLPHPDDASALACIDLMLYVGTPCFVHFLITNASFEYGFLLQATVASERCRLQLVRAAMLSQDWTEATALIEELFGSTDRIREAHVLLGECFYRAAREASGGAKAAAYGPALEAFENALSFIPEAQEELPKDDPVLHLRIASIYFLRAEETAFVDAEAVSKALMHYKRVLLVAPTTDAWCNSGICALCRARLLPRQRDGSEEHQARQDLLQQALRHLSEANMLDRCRPQVNAWLVICTVELGKVQVAKQAFRQVMRYKHQLNASTMLEMAEVLLRFSDEHLPDVLQQERESLVRDGRYASEALAAAHAVLEREASGHARYVLARALVMLGEDTKAVREFCDALRGLAADHPRRKEVVNDARACATRILGEPLWALQVEEAIAAPEGS